MVLLGGSITTGDMGRFAVAWRNAIEIEEHTPIPVHDVIMNKSGATHWGPKCKKRGPQCGPPYKSNSSRIASQHHRRNGKSFQCPFNVPVLVTIHLCGLLLC